MWFRTAAACKVTMTLITLIISFYKRQDLFYVINYHVQNNSNSSIRLLVVLSNSQCMCWMFPSAFFSYICFQPSGNCCRITMSLAYLQTSKVSVFNWVYVKKCPKYHSCPWVLIVLCIALFLENESWCGCFVASEISHLEKKRDLWSWENICFRRLKSIWR